MGRPLLIGEANPYGADPRYALYPEPERSAGGRLCRMVMGLTPREYLRRFERVNLCARAWSISEAREKARELRRDRGLGAQVFVLLGAKVCAAFDHPFEPLSFDGEHRVVILPHPSGLCRLWNRPGAVEQARATLRAAGIDLVAPKPRPEHNYHGNCCAGAAPSEECERHRQWRGECPYCPPCPACDLEWAEGEAANGAEAASGGA